MRKCQFEPVGQAQLTQTCDAEATHRVEYYIGADKTRTCMAQRYCRYHAERVRDYLQSGPVSARIVEIPQ